jgi:histidyl-tRNA synthetase
VKISTKPPKGTRDFLAADVRRRRFVTETIEQVYRSYGYEPLETPSFERLDTLLGKYGDEGDQLVFKVLHRGQSLVTGIREAAEQIQQPGVVSVGRSGETAASVEGLLSDLGLRYDLTVPLARVVAQYRGKLPAPYRRYQIQPVWRADTPAKGRFREFYQCDVDVVGTSSRVAEVEVTAAVSECLDRLGFGSARIKINHRRLLRAAIHAASVPPELEVSAIVALDKLDKIGPEGVREELAGRGVSEEASRRMLDALDPAASLDDVAAFVGSVDEGRAAVEDLRLIFQLAVETPAGPRLTFDSTLARGLGYYTGAIFEVSVPEFGGSLGGGGRYDGLVGMFSAQSVPACGFSIGLERILVVMEEQGMFPSLEGPSRVLLAVSEEAAWPVAFRWAHALRRVGFVVELRPEATKPGPLRKDADARGFAAALRVEPERSDVELWLRRSPSVRDRRIQLDQLLETLRSEA